MPNELTRALVRQDLNRTRADPVAEVNRILAKQAYCDAWRSRHPNDHHALKTAFLCCLSAGRTAMSFALIGAALKTAAKAGHESVHGTKAEKAGRWAAYQAAIDRRHQLSPHLSYESLAEDVAKRFGVHRETVKDHTRNPRKK